MHDMPVKNIVIAGGGTAGWLTAALIASEYACGERDDVRVTLVESPDVATIGVGEGTWPTMRSTLRRIGLSETDFLVRCSASFKQGTKFVGWVTGDADDSYYHPFSAPAGYGHLNLVPHWQPQRGKVSFVDAVSTQGRVCDRDLAPKQGETPEYAAVVNYAYHLDAGRFADMLTEHCTGRLGVRHVRDHIVAVNGSPDEDIRSLQTREFGEIEGDLFVDCTGLGTLLLDGHYGVPFVDHGHVLFNDSALALQVPYEDAGGPIASQTISTAQSAGWIWDIGLTNRRGIGYTYSSRHASDDAAQQTLLDYVAALPNSQSVETEPRKITFRPGHRAKFWHRNCVAVGMASGFLEPLEASALVMVELAGQMISEELPGTRAVMDVVSERYNEKFLYRWERIIEFLKLHYVLSRRPGAYWDDNRDAASIPEHLQALLQLWRHHVPWHNDFSQRDEIFSSASYQYVLYGMGFETAVRASSRQARQASEALELFVDNDKQSRKQLDGLPGNRELLDLLANEAAPEMS